HLVRLEITATPSKSITSLFLIVTKQHNCARKIACRAGCRALTFRVGRSHLTHALSISNRHFVRLEITATNAESTRSLFLIVTKRPQFQRVDYTRQLTCVSPVRYSAQHYGRESVAVLFFEFDFVFLLGFFFGAFPLEQFFFGHLVIVAAGHK